MVTTGPRRFFVLFVSLGACVVPFASAQEASPPPDDLQALRSEIQALRADYERRLADLEARLGALTPAASPAAEATQAPAPEPPASPPPEAPPPSLPTALTAGAAPPSGKVFNPDIAVIGNFLGAAGHNDSPDAPPSLELDEVEATFQAAVDPYARADFFLAFSPQGTDIEEGFITFPTLPAGLLMKVGKMRSSFGRVNQMHNHVMPWTDRPLLTTNLLGGDEGISNAGVSISRLVQNPVAFLEATGEVYRGDDEVFSTSERDDLTWVGRLRAYRDLTESTNLDLGGSIAYGGNAEGPGFHTRLIGADLTFRYRPLRRAIYKRLMGRAEAVWSRREAPGGDADAFGIYVSGEYQFARRWFAGARYDYAERPAAPDLADEGGSLLLTFWPSEFSQVRTQLRRTRFGEGHTANEFLFQFLFSIGAHGAHAF
ncbi:MAG TPA: hypothetical protein VFQ51_18405 [Vicinamibacteria bacterium]|nr:hypothetical protein [Vicinamibacteria bacterium]